MQRNSIEEAMLNGVSEQELRTQFERQIKDAIAKKAELERAKKTAQEAKLDEARTKLAEAVVAYTDALGVTPPKNKAEIVKGLTEMFEDLEKEMAEMRALVDGLGVFGAMLKREMAKEDIDQDLEDPDDVIKRFLRTL